MMGFDAVYIRHDTPESLLDEALSGRIVLTRRSRLRDRMNVHVVVHDRVVDQIRALAAVVDLAPWVEPFTRCSLCNTVLTTCEPAEAQGLVPEYVFLTHDTFARCAECGRVYWKGTHHGRIRDTIDRVIGERGS